MFKVRLPKFIVSSVGLSKSIVSQIDKYETIKSHSALDENIE